MPTIQEIIDQNNAAADYVAHATGPIDILIADYVLLNTSEASRKLTLDDVAELGKPAVNALLDAANIAKKVFPLSDADMQKLDGESDNAHGFRVNVQQPLRRLRSVVSSGSYEDDHDTIASIKTAVSVGSTAFAAILSDPVALRDNELNGFIGYFGSNASAAADRVSRSKPS